MAVVGAIGSIAGSLIGAAGAMAQGQAQAAEARYQAQVARNNAIVARKNAEYALVAGAREEEAYRIKGTVLRSMIRAKFGASGVDVNVGSPVEIQRSAAVMQELDALTIRNNAVREAWNFRVQARGFKAEAGLDEMQADAAETAGMFGALSSIAGAVSSVSPRWGSWRSPTPYTPVSYGPSTTSPAMAVPITTNPPGAGLSSPAYVPRTSPGRGPDYR